MRRFINHLTPTSNIVFSKQTRIKHQDKRATNPESHVYDYLREYAAKDICDRIEDLTFNAKRKILCVGSCSSLVTKNLNHHKVEGVLETDISSENIKKSRELSRLSGLKFPIDHLVCDEERLPFRDDSVDLAVSCLHLHWVNDLMGCFRQINGILRKNSPFVGVVFGGDTLYELRSSLQLAELERISGFSSHVAPKTTGQDIARLLQASGFNLITVDVDDVVINYPSMFELMFDLQGMGENNKSLQASRHLHREVLLAGSAIYQSLYGVDEPNKSVPATFQLIHFIGWKDRNKNN